MTAFRSSHYAILALAALVHVLGARVDVMDVDAAQYASMAREMLDTGQWLQLFNRGEAYLDKPPLHFWLAALSMKCFGVNNVAYKLPSLIGALLAIFSTYRLARIFYSAQVASSAALVLASCVALPLMTNDVRTDTLLQAFTVGAIWLGAEFGRSGAWRHIIGASVMMALAMLTKGPIGAVLPVIAIGSHAIFQKNLSSFITPKLLVVPVIILVLLSPMLYGLHTQHGFSGIKFYFWTQSFGRITGESKWANDGSFFYFSHVLLWAFAPWSLVGLGAIAKKCTALFSNRRQNEAEWISISAVVLGYVMFSLSRYKLPHYIFLLLPFWAILTAGFLEDLSVKGLKYTHLFFSFLMVIVVLVLALWAFPATSFPIYIAIMAVVLGAVFHFRKALTAVQYSAAVALSAFVGLNGHVYPELLKYQANAVVGKWVVERQLGQNEFVSFSTGGHSLDFYAQRIVPWQGSLSLVSPYTTPGHYVYANADRYADLLAAGAMPKQVIEFSNYKVQLLTLKFINPNTRNEALSKNYVLVY